MQSVRLIWKRFFDVWVKHHESRLEQSADIFNFEASKLSWAQLAFLFDSGNNFFYMILYGSVGFHSLACVIFGSAFYSLLDDCPLRSNESSESVLVATHFRNPTPVGKSSLSDDKCQQEFEDGFLTLITSDSPGLQVILINFVFFSQGYLRDLNSK